MALCEASQCYPEKCSLVEGKQKGVEEGGAYDSAFPLLGMTGLHQCPFKVAQQATCKVVENVIYIYETMLFCWHLSYNIITNKQEIRQGE